MVIWLGEELVVKRVAVDHSFWNESFKKKLEFFFMEAMLKELADSRRMRKMKMRKYDPATKTFV